MTDVGVELRVKEFFVLETDVHRDVQRRRGDHWGTQGKGEKYGKWQIYSFCDICRSKVTPFIHD